MPNEKNDYKKLFVKLVYGLVVVLFLGLVGMNKYNFDCDAQRETEAKEARKESEMRQKEKVEGLRRELEKDIKEIKASQEKMEGKMDKGFEKISELIMAK